MAALPIFQCAIGEALPAPIERRHRKASRPQVAHRLKILLDELRPTLQHANRAFAARRRQPTRVAQTHAVRRLKGAGNGVLGRGIGGNGDEFHGAGGVAL